MPQDDLDIRLIVTDVDGVLTDGTIAIDQEGRRSRRFSVHDGLAFVMARSVGLPAVIMTAKNAPEVLARAEELGVEDVHMGVESKGKKLRDIARDHGVEPGNVFYMGDDLWDLPALRLAGFAATVPGAPAEVRAAADYVTTRSGGEGAFREAVEELLRGLGLYGKARESIVERA